MDFKYIFGQFYTKYRGEENPPDDTDPEWKIAVRNYNAALDYLEEYDDTKWAFMRSTLQNSDFASASDYRMTTGKSSFTAPSDMVYPGGLFWKVDTNGNRGVPRKVYQLEDVATLSQESTFGYFLGDKDGGYTFYLNPSVNSSENNWLLDYIYFKTLPRLDPDTEDGTTILCGASSEFLACFMAAQRFLDSRNFPAYNVMKRDSENSVKNMKLRNNSGDAYNPPMLQDTGPGWGY